MINVPNTITTLRLLMLYYCILNKDNNEFKTYLFGVIFWGLDFVDGKVARYLNQVTKFGGFYDYLVDYTYYLYSLYNLHTSLRNKYRIIISKIHILITSIHCTYTLFNSSKARHGFHSNKLVQLYQKNNFKNILAGLLIVNNSLFPYFLYTRYNIFIDIVFILGEILNYYILTLRSIGMLNK